MNDFVSVIVLTKNIIHDWIRKFVVETRQSQHQETEIIVLDDGQDRDVSNVIRDLALRNGPVRILRYATNDEMAGIKQAVDKAHSDYILICRPFMTLTADLKRAIIQLKSSKAGWLLGKLRVGEKIIEVDMDYDALQTGTLRLAPILFFRRPYIYPNELPLKGHFPYQLLDYLLHKKTEMTILDEVWGEIYPETYDSILNSVYSIEAPILPIRVRGSGSGDHPLSESLNSLANSQVLARERGRVGPMAGGRSPRTRRRTGGGAEQAKIVYPETVVVIPLTDPEAVKELVAKVKADTVGKDLEIMVVGQIVPGIEKWIIAEGLRALIYQENKSEWDGFVLAKKVIYDQSDLIYIRPGAVLPDRWMQMLKGNVGNTPGSCLGVNIFMLSKASVVPGNCQSLDDLLGRLTLVE